MYVAVDFDGTIVEHKFPIIGKSVPGAFKWMRKLAVAGAKLILWTVRSDGGKCGNVLSDAVEYCRNRGVEFYGVNENPDQKAWSSSPKVYANFYVDDAAEGCPLLAGRAGTRPMVDWEAIGPKLLERVSSGV